MKRVLSSLALCLAVLISACNTSAPQSQDTKYQIQMYVSLGGATVFPSGASSNLTDYWGKPVYFSVNGVDSTNSTIGSSATVKLNWTGSDPASGTQYAEKTFTLLNSQDAYPGGSYKFLIYIDMNDNGVMDTGDIAMGSYSIIADTDNNPSTPGESITPAQYGGYVTYNSSDKSLTVDDPLALAGGFPWKIDAIHEGNLEQVP